jgi:hypothetical protein
MLAFICGNVLKWNYGSCQKYFSPGTFDYESAKSGFIILQ